MTLGLNQDTKSLQVNRRQNETIKQNTAPSLARDQSEKAPPISAQPVEKWRNFLQDSRSTAEKIWSSGREHRECKRGNPLKLVKRQGENPELLENNWIGGGPGRPKQHLLHDETVRPQGVLRNNGGGQVLTCPDLTRTGGGRDHILLSFFLLPHSVLLFFHLLHPALCSLLPLSPFFSTSLHSLQHSRVPVRAHLHRIVLTPYRAGLVSGCPSFLCSHLLSFLFVAPA